MKTQKFAYGIGILVGLSLGFLLGTTAIGWQLLDPFWHRWMPTLIGAYVLVAVGGFLRFSGK